MKQILASVLIVALSFSAAQAQSKGKQNGTRHQDKEHKMDYEKLNLSADQGAQLKAVNAEFKKQHEALKNNSALTNEQKKTRMQELKEGHKAAINAILTSEQEERLAQLKSGKTGKTGKFETKKDKVGRDTSSFKNTYGRKQNNKGADMRKDLNLSAEQQNKMTAIRKQYKTKTEALRNDNSLTESQKKARLMELRKAQNEEIKALMTPDQREKMQSGRKERARNTK